MHEFKSNFETSKFDDAPNLSDQLLLPNLARGYNLFLVSAFVPSYIERVLRDLANSPEIEPGHLSITFYVPGNLVKSDTAVLRVRNYFETGLGSQGRASEFIDNSLQLIEEGSLSIKFIHGPQASPITKGCFGVFTYLSDQDFVAIEDAKGGDYNSPVRPKRSWVADEFSVAEKTLQRLNGLIQGSRPNSLLVDEQTAIRWLSAMYLWYEAQSKTQSASDQDTESLEAIQDIDDAEFLDFIQEDVEFEVGWDEESYVEDTTRFFSGSGFSVPVAPEEIEGHHVPPLPESIATVIGMASAKCPCGRKFLRVNGCDAVSW